MTHLILQFAREDLFDSLRRDCAWANPGARRDKLNMTFREKERTSPLPWQKVHPLVRELADELICKLGVKLNSCAVHWYRVGTVENEWHSDDDLDDTQPVVIVSLGAERVFETRRVGDESVEQRVLPHRSIFVMPPGYQQTHEHRLPAADESIGDRISLVFAQRL